MRKYIAMYDDGHDYGDFEFGSEHRAGSKKNLKDAYDTAKQRYGFNRAKRINIYKTELMP